MNTYLIQWRFSYDDDDSLSFVKSVYGPRIAAAGFCEAQCVECGKNLREDGTFDHQYHQDTDPAYYIINILQMPEGFDPNQVKWI